MVGRAITPEFWAGRSVLITGHTGFKGSWLALWLSTLGAKVHGLSLDPETHKNHYDLANLKNLMQGDYRGDIRDMDVVQQAVQDSAPEIVFHLAAQPLVRRAHAQPVETFATNVMGTVNILEALRTAPTLKACIAVTTDKVYRNVEWAWPYRETDALGGHEPYGTSKAAAEMAIEAWRDSYFTPRGVGLVSVRAGNVIGGGDWSVDRLIPDFVRAIEKGSPIVLRNPTAVRPWQHVLEPLKGYMIAAEQLAKDPQSLSPALNFGPDFDDFRSVREVVTKAVDIWGEGASWEHQPDESIPESTLLTLDNSLARKELLWRPTWSFDDCMEKTFEWFRTASAPSENIKDLSLSQISEFNLKALS